MSRTLHIQTNISSYDIKLEEDFQNLYDSIRNLHIKAKKICIVTDTNVEKLYLKEVKKIFADLSYDTYDFCFKAGEKSKNLDTVSKLYGYLISNQFDRKDILVALGGGVVGDLCGFVAATYLRGIDFIQIPTTLLSQVDSSIGGKVGVDFEAYKNMVGAFHSPILVYISAICLQTLPESELASGMAEVIKHGLIRDASYYRWIRENKEQLLKRDTGTLLQAVCVSDEIKKAVVEEDPKEEGIRGILNFGHTLGHAIEKEMNFKLSHGACVGLGCLAAYHIAMKRGYLTEDNRRELEELLQYFKLPIRLRDLNYKNIIKLTKNDKKMEAGSLKFILLKKIGNAYIDKTVSEEEMKRALESIYEE